MIIFCSARLQRNKKELENPGDFQLFIYGRALVSEMVQTYPRALLLG